MLYSVYGFNNNNNNNNNNNSNRRHDSRFVNRSSTQVMQYNHDEKDERKTCFINTLYAIYSVTGYRQGVCV